MADKVYRFPHELGEEEARRRILPIVDDLCRSYGLSMSSPSPDRIVLTRSGVTADIQVAAQTISVRVDLNWFLEKAVRQQVEDRLHQMFPEVLKPTV